MLFLTGGTENKKNAGTVTWLRSVGWLTTGRDGGNRPFCSASPRAGD